MNNVIEAAHKLMLGTDESIHTPKGLSVDDSLVERVELALGTRLPSSYKYFLKKYGNLSFYGETFFGLTKGGVDADSSPSVVFLTKALRSRGDASNEMIKVKTSGYGPNFCIDMSEVDENGEGAVYEVPLSYKHNGEKTKVANNFADFFL